MRKVDTTRVLPARTGGNLARRATAVSRYRPVAGFLVVLAVGAALRLTGLSKPDWQYDEGVYTRVAQNLLQHGTLTEHIGYGVPSQPFLYQPPMYFLALSRWFALTGPGIYQARLMGVICVLAMFVALYALLRRLHGPLPSLFAVTPVILDGWLLYVQRVSYMENVTLLLVVVSLLAYQWAVDRPSWQRFALAGALLGLTACFKYDGSYVIVAVLLCWLIRRREHRGHLILLGAFVVVVAAYIATMISVYDVPGHDWFSQQTIVQIRRVLGLQKSGGTLTSPAQLMHLLFHQYLVFLPSFLLALGSFLIVARRLISCYRQRSWVPVQDNALLFSWLAAGAVVFGLSTLRFQQYFALFLVPMYCFLWIEFWQWDWSRRLKAVAVAAAVVAGLGSFWLRVPAQSGNPFKDVQQYAATRIPGNAIVVTEESMGDLIAQPWCRVQDATPCIGVASYAITWQTYLQSSFELGDSAFHQIMRGAVRLTSFSGFSGTATVWRLQQQTLLPSTQRVKPPGVHTAKRPAEPTGTHATSVTATTVTLDWTKVADATSYRIRVTYQGKLVRQEWVRGTSAKVSRLTPDHTYTFHVAAENRVGRSAETGQAIKTHR